MLGLVQRKLDISEVDEILETGKDFSLPHTIF
jgi:hypothetical protein